MFLTNIKRMFVFFIQIIKENRNRMKTERNTPAVTNRYSIHLVKRKDTTSGINCTAERNKITPLPLPPHGSV